MAGLRPGDRLEMLAPLGHGFFPEDYLAEARADDEVLHVAGGIGIAALLLAARELAGQGIPQRLFFGGRTKEDLVGVEDFKPYVRATVLATASAPVTGGRSSGLPAPASTRNTTSGSSTANNASKSPLRDAARKASTTSR